MSMKGTPFFMAPEVVLQQVSPPGRLCVLVLLGPLPLRILRIVLLLLFFLLSCSTCTP